MKGVAVAMASIIVAGCSTTIPEQPLGQYCYTDKELQVVDDEITSSKAVIKCSDKPKVNHVTRSAGVSKECRSYRHTIRQKGVTRHVKGFLCKFPDGTWEPVNGVFAY